MFIISEYVCVYILPLSIVFEEHLSVCLSIYIYTHITQQHSLSFWSTVDDQSSTHPTPRFVVAVVMTIDCAWVDVSHSAATSTTENRWVRAHSEYLLMVAGLCEVVTSTTPPPHLPTPEKR